MTNPIQNFEFVIKKQCTKMPKSLYNSNKQQNVTTYKPQDVISSVSLQMKAIQVADSLKNEKRVKKLNHLKKSTFLSVNNLPTYDEVHKQTVKFDTQFVTDTQLINIIEDAEIIDVHRGMTQEFESSFCQTETKDKMDSIDRNSNIHAEDLKSSVKTEQNVNEEDDNVLAVGVVTEDKNNIKIKDLSKSLDLIKDNAEDIAVDINDKDIVNDIDRLDTDDGNASINMIEYNNDDKNKGISHETTFDTQFEEYSQMLNKCIEIEDNDGDIERPVSPIFMQKSVKPKSKSPSPLIFSLDKFEKFEQIAMSTFECNDLKTAKHVINSQIIDSELQIKVNEEIPPDKELNDVVKDERCSVIFKNEDKLKYFTGMEFKSLIVEDRDLEIQFLELDKETSEDLINKVKGNVENTEILKDEILFSSDEEEFVQKSYQDLPFTCALETSFYNHPEDLDKTMFVGFQTASNKSIQIFTDSFAQAKSLLSNVSDDEITVTDLVNNCDGNVKSKVEDQAKIDSINQEKQHDLPCNENAEPLDKVSKNVEENILNENSVNMSDDKKDIKINFQGFKTASNKNIKLSEKALARCNKVFQDIDINEDFNSQTKHTGLLNDASKEDKSTITKIPETKGNKNLTDDIQNMDDIIIQEFENIEMSLEEDKNVQIIKTSIENKADSGSDRKVEEISMEKYQDYVKDIDFDNDFSQVGTETDLPENIIDTKSKNNKNTNTDTKTLHHIQEFESIDKIIENMNVNQQQSIFVGFKRANNTNINISKQALAKSKSIFKYIDSTEFKLPKEILDIEKCPKDFVIQSESNGFEGFKTAGNKNIAISKESLAKTVDIFKDLDSDDFKLPKKVKKDYINEPKETMNLEQPSTSKTRFIGFKTANNEEIEISKESIAKTKDIFKDIDTIHGEEQRLDTGGFDRSVNVLPSFVGFKTANNKNVKISDAALAKTRNVFKDIDSDDFKFPSKTNKEPHQSQEELTEHKFCDENESLKAAYPRKDIGGYNNSSKTIDLNESFTSKAKFVGFKTANNRNINISEASIAKTKNIFKDIEDKDFTFSEREDRTGKGLDDIQSSHSKSAFIGFKTANNKAISVSAAALAKSKNIFKDIDEQCEGKNKEKEDYPIINKDSYEEEKNDMENRIKDGPIPKFEGFTTASNKKVKVSEEALIKSKNIFKDIDQHCEINIKDKEYYPTINNDSNETEVTERKIMENKVKDIPIPTFRGFATASNKKVEISEEALIKSKNIFKGIDDYAEKLNSKENLVESHDDDDKISTNIDLSDPNDCKNGSSSPIFKGFKTASKKSVTISKEALAKSKELFNNIDSFNEPEFCGFKTANDNQVNISEKLLKEAKDIFDDDKIIGSFKGFQTASDKKVVITEESLAKSRKLFHDIDVRDNSEKSGLVEKRTLKFGFKTGSNQDVAVSEEAVARTKKRFSEIDDSNINNKKEKLPEVANEILDTQVLNNFEESLHTEDFHDTPTKSKRSGSPILSCPKAKRRKKFETPYSTQKLPKKVPAIEKTDKNINKITFTENYKKNKCFTLKDLQKQRNNDNNIIDSYLIQFNFDTLLKFEFRGQRNNLTDTELTVDLLKELFTNSVNAKLIPNGWLENHIKLIIWKLISYEVKYNLNVCDAKNVIDQLKFRYDKELYHAQRPAVRKILEKDDLASKTMVLCVAGIYVDGVSVTSASTTNLELLLTDGWYCILATPDKMLAQLVCDGRVTVGSKIVTNGAELVNCEQGVSPWEDTSAVRLKIFGNSTRRACWDARLGYHSNAAILSQLSTVKLDGGKVSKLRVFITRVYPAMYVEKFEDGSTVTRSERLEHLHQMKTEAERQSVMEKVYEEVEKEFADQESQDSEGLSDSCNRTCLDSGSQIAKLMKNSRDPAEFRAQLTSSQNRLLESHTNKRREHLLEEMQKRIRQKVETAGVHVNRNVVALLKIRVAGVEERGVVTKGMMSIWKPTDAVQEIIKEGTWVDVMNVVPTAVRYSEIQISAGRQSIFNASKYKVPEKIKPYTTLLKRKCYTIKDLAENPAMPTDFNEIDTVGFIFLIDPSIQDFESTKQSFQNVYLADIDKKIICVNFWGGLKKFGFHNVLDTGQVVSCVNLQKRAGNTRKTIPQFRVTEFSYFTKTPKNDVSRVILDDLNRKFLSLDRRKFCNECVELKNNYSVLKNNNENVSPYRFNNSDWNRSKNRIFIDSPLTKPNKIDDFNLAGLDFESTFKQTDTQNLSEEVLIRKKKVNEKIARLKMYGEPPPLTNLHIINKSKSASNSYKSPLLTENNQERPHKPELSNSKSDSCINVASNKSSPENCGDLNNSSVVLNRTYVKSIEPVKINFDVKDVSNVDHFAEDFDGSPPLSLD